MWRKIPWPNLFCLWSLSVFYPYRAWPVSWDSLHRDFFFLVWVISRQILRKYATGLQRNLHHPGRFNEGNIKIANKILRLNLLADKKKLLQELKSLKPNFLSQSSLIYLQKKLFQILEQYGTNYLQQLTVRTFSVLSLKSSQCGRILYRHGCMHWLVPAGPRE